MATITIEQPHALPTAEAQKRLDQSLGQLAHRYRGEFRWQSETEATIKHAMANASVRIEPARVIVTVQCGMALSLIKGKLETRVKQELEKALAPAAV